MRFQYPPLITISVQGTALCVYISHSSPEVIDGVFLEGVRFLLRLSSVASLLRSHHPTALLRSLQREKRLKAKFKNTKKKTLNFLPISNICVGY